eukprot:scaffold7039_cov35-Prasinocladus_malaysianus.AAC.1
MNLLRRVPGSLPEPAGAKCCQPKEARLGIADRASGGPWHHCGATGYQWWLLMPLQLRPSRRRAQRL